jgi:hypothetical protein
MGAVGGGVGGGLGALLLIQLTFTKNPLYISLTVMWVALLISVPLYLTNRYIKVKLEKPVKTLNLQPT